MFGLFLSGCDKEIQLIIISTNTEFGDVFVVLFKFRKIYSKTIYSIVSIYIFVIANTPATYILCLIVSQTWCYLCIKNVPNWLSVILIIISNDVHLNPGPQYQNNFFNFMSWNVNSIAKDNFQRVQLIEAHNSIFNYDLISICANTQHGGVGLFYKNSLPVKIQNGLSFDESIEVELKYGRKKIFFTV